MTAVLQENFKKCGEITKLQRIDEKIYALNCIFCEEIYLELENFVKHIEETHYIDIYDTPETEDVEILDEHRDIYVKYIKKENNVLDIEQRKIGTDNEEDFAKEIKSDLEDPLEEIVNDAVDVDEQKHDTVKELEELKREHRDPLEEPESDSFEGDTSKIDDDVSEKAMEISKIIIADNENVEKMKYSVTNDTEDDNDNNSDIESMDESNSQADDNFAGFDQEKNKLTLAIINGYEKHPILWNTKHSNAKSRQRREEAFQKIANSINKRFDLYLNWKNISTHIKKLRYKFRTELQNKKVAEKSGDIYTPIWYFDKLAFLNESIQYKQRKKRGAKALANEKPTLPIPNLNHKQNVDLIEIYKSYPCLWDVEHIGYRFKNQRQEALEEIIQVVKNKMNLEITQDDLLKKLYRIRYACTQEKHRKLRCEQLDEKFEPICEYYEKILFLNDSVGPFKCEYCEEILNGADQYRIHRSSHDGSMPFSCPLCCRGFMKVGNCTVHLRRHTRDYPFQCKECGKRYATSTDINVHMRYHTGEKPYFCEICGQSFRTWTFFDAHMRRHEKRPTHKCTLCPKKFYENNKLSEHMKAHFNVRDKICNTCGKAFTSSKYLRQHKQIHADKKKYVCIICAKEFAQHAGLSGHMKTHGTTVKGFTEEKI